MYAPKVSINTVLQATVTPDSTAKHKIFTSGRLKFDRVWVQGFIVEKSERVVTLEERGFAIALDLKNGIFTEQYADLATGDYCLVIGKVFLQKNQIKPIIKGHKVKVLHDAEVRQLLWEEELVQLQQHFYSDSTDDGPS